MILLDTHFLIWYFEKNKKFSKEASKKLATISEESPAFVSDITLWEIAMLVDYNRIQISYPLAEWLSKAVAPPLIRRIGISPEIAAQSVALPENFHGDPADRIIVATAIITGATLLTVDSGIIDTKVCKVVS